MKKIKIFITLFLCTAMAAAILTGCANAASSDDGSNGNGTSSGSYQVGDIVLNDGTYLRNVATVSNADKAKAIAVIYKVSGSTAYGVGLVHTTSGIQWCTNSANAHNQNITTIQCPVTGSTGNYTFSGDTDGSDNLAQIAAFLTTDDTSTNTECYPAFYFAQNYASQTNSHVANTDYATGWYLPTIAELYDIWSVKATIDEKSALAEGSQFGTRDYWSSSQYVDGNDSACLMRFSNGQTVEHGKTLGNNIMGYCYACAIRAFN